MKWVEFSVDTPPEFVEPLSYVFYCYGLGGVATEELAEYSPDEGENPPSTNLVTVRTYIPFDERVQKCRDQIASGIALISNVAPISELRQKVLQESDWENSWKEHFQILHIGQKVVVVPTWRKYERKIGDVVISLDPGMAFGTGHHPTTKMCLNYLEKLVTLGIDVLDVGCGSGILSIAASKLGANEVVGLEIEEMSARVAKENVHTNMCQETVRIENGTLPNPTVLPGIFDLVLANISAKVIIEIADELVSMCRPGGKMLLSGVLLEREEEVTDRLSSFGANLISRSIDGDWTCFLMDKH